LLLFCQPAGQARDDAPAKGGAQVQEEGPIHEAFAAPRSLARQRPQQVNQQPPDEVNEEIPDDKPEDEDAQWIPGYWDNDGANDFVWVSGCWRVPPPGRQWICGYWQQVNARWRRQPGFWTQYSDSDESQDLSYCPEPPEPQEEDPGEDPDGESDYFPGNWTYSPDGGGFSWNPGIWVRRRPDWLWTPSNWWWTPAGYLFNRGFWDYSYVRRGWPYAPVRIPRNLVRRPYRPTHVVSPRSINRRTLSPVGHRYRLKGAVVKPINSLGGLKKVRLTPAQRKNLSNLTKKIHKTGPDRKTIEGKGKHPGKGVVRHKVNVPKPRAKKNPVRPPARPPNRVGKKTGSSGSTHRPTTGGPRKPPIRPGAAKTGTAGGPKKPATRPPGKKRAPKSTPGTGKKPAGPAKRPGGSVKKPGKAHTPTRKPSTAHRPAPKKSPAKKSGAARKPVTKKSAPRKAAPKKAAPRKSAAHRAPPRRAGSARTGGGGRGGGGRGGGGRRR
jgi:hypothetical protein